MITKERPKTGMYANVQEQFDQAADLMNLNPSVRKILAITNSEIVVHFPVKMDDGRLETFTGYRVQHNNALGPYKGGIRYHPDVSIDEVRALARSEERRVGKECRARRQPQRRRKRRTNVSRAQRTGAPHGHDTERE